MKILLLTALEEEKLKVLPENVVHEITGMGQVNAITHAALYIKKHSPDFVIMLGACGALSPTLVPGDVVIGNRFVNGDYDASALLDNFEKDIIVVNNNLKLPFKFGTFYTTSTFVLEAQKKLLKGDVVDMESFGVAKLCEKLGLPFVICKIVSDKLEGNSKDDFLDFMKNKYHPDDVLNAILQTLL